MGEFCSDSMEHCGRQIQLWVLRRTSIHHCCRHSVYDDNLSLMNTQRSRLLWALVHIRIVSVDICPCFPQVRIVENWHWLSFSWLTRLLQLIVLVDSVECVFSCNLQPLGHMVQEAGTLSLNFCLMLFANGHFFVIKDCIWTRLFCLGTKLKFFWHLSCLCKNIKVFIVNGLII